VEAPVVEAPVVEAPVVEAPVVEAPVVEAPVVEAPVVEALVVEAPVVSGFSRTKFCAVLRPGQAAPPNRASAHLARRVRESDVSLLTF
jgi:ribonuclease E